MSVGNMATQLREMIETRATGCGGSSGRGSNHSSSLKSSVSQQKGRAKSRSPTRTSQRNTAQSGRSLRSSAGISDRTKQSKKNGVCGTSFLCFPYV